MDRGAASGRPGRRHRDTPLRRDRDVRPAADGRSGRAVGTSRSPACPSTAAPATGPAPASARPPYARAPDCSGRTTRPSMPCPSSRPRSSTPGDIACSPVRQRGGRGADSGGRRRTALQRGPPGRGGRRPHHRAPAAAGDGAPSRAAGAGPLRRPPRHLGHLLRRALHTRHTVPPRLGGGSAPSATAASTSGCAGRSTRRTT